MAKIHILQKQKVSQSNNLNIIQTQRLHSEEDLFMKLPIEDHPQEKSSVSGTSSMSNLKLIFLLIELGTWRKLVTSIHKSMLDVGCLDSLLSATK